MAEDDAPDDWEAEMGGEAEVEETATTNGHHEQPTDKPNGDAARAKITVPVTNSAETTANGKASESEADDDDDDDDEEDEVDYSTAVLNTYRKLLSRRVDLVGDYAGNELFVIDGDSMLLRCFSDERLDFHSGFQLLHATYNVEQLLSHLVRRKCNFHIVFFDSTKSLCVPPTSSVADVPKYLLARAAIIRHLQSHLAALHGTLEVHEFSSYTSEEFDGYLRMTSPYFIMANDGASAAKRLGKRIDSDAETTRLINANRAALREMIVFYIEHGYNVALLNGLEWRDTKVMAMVLERRSRALIEISGDRGQLQPDVGSSKDDEGESISKMLAQVRELAPKLSQRQLLSILALSTVVSSELLEPPTLASLSHAFLLHQAVLAHIPLSSRRLNTPRKSAEQEKFLQAVATSAEHVLSSSSWRQVAQGSGSTCDLSDFVDGRLFYACINSPPQLEGKMQNTYDALFAALMGLTRLAMPSSDVHGHGKESTGKASDGLTDAASMTIMPFSNPVFDKHLTSVRLRTDERAAGQQTASANRIFREVTHWHNAKKPLIQRGPPTAQDAKQAFWAAKRNQQFMAEMQKYAASLTNAVGGTLEPEIIIVGANKSKPIHQASSGTQTPDSDSTDDSSTASKGKQQQKGGGGKKGKQNTGKQAMMNQIAEAKAKKESSAGGKIVNAWHLVCKDIEASGDPKTKYKRVQAYLASLKPEVRTVVAAECQLYMLSCLMQHWVGICRNGSKSKNMDVAALIWNTCRSIRTSEGLTEEIWSQTDSIAKTMGLPSISAEPVRSLPSRKLGFSFTALRSTDDVSVGLDPRTFQLRHCGPYLDRGFDSRPDSRVEFQPDGWQRRVLDAIDDDKSVFAVAPTSAGKTFISFYAMRKVLEADDNSVLVYVAPTKALVNQIAAEIQARYSKKFKYGGKSVWAIHTRDYRINNPTGCQVLVTVPHVLQIMLLAPTNANSWSSRVKRIIFDEVHSIGQAEDGVVWEQLLLLSPCPIIALSATVGNPKEFSDWLSATQSTIGVDLVTVQHPHRYSDLRKYYYVPPESFAFQGLPDKTAFGKMGLEQGEGINRVHPIAGLIDRSRGIPEDLAMEPSDCLELYNAMRKHATDAYPVSQDLAPEKALPIVSKKVDILNWEKNLKTLLKTWIADRASPYEHVVRDLERDFHNNERQALQTTRDASAAEDAQRSVNPDDLFDSTLPLLCRLNEQDALPGILFNYDRHQCEKLCRALVDQLVAAETDQVKSGSKWEKKLERWEEWKKASLKAAEREAKAGKKKAGKKDKGEDDEKSSKLDQQMDAGASDASSWESFDPEAPVSGYTFADSSKVLLSEMEIYVRQLKRREIEPYLINGLLRGIGVHHAGMNRKYRQIVEILFRQGFLRVVVATGTLAMGINMPCKTVVFSGDSVFLTALNYRQCAGRAGRRGFDLLGNVVFHGLTRAKVCRLISSRLPDLNGHFPITTTLVLRLFTLLHESKNSSYAISAINALLSQPRMYMGGASFKEQTMHHLRFSIEYLRRQYLLGSNGAPLNFAGLVSHLYFTENSAFAFHALLKEGYFHELCANIEKSEKDTMETLMLVMAHLFNRTPCRQVDEEYREKAKASSSIVFLPNMPKKAADILRRHNGQTLDVYRTYVESFVEQHISTVDRELPLTGVKAGADDGTDVLESLPSTKTRSAFVALSGHGDDFESISSLCQTTREGVFLEEAVIPYVTIHPDETNTPLNAFLLDFFKHGDVHTIERANGVRRSDIWFLLNDFSMVLATLIASIASFMKLKDANDMDMLDVMGDFDAHEEATDEKAAVNDEGDNMSVGGASVADSVIGVSEPAAKQVSKKKAKNADSWEDVADEENALASVEEAYQKSGAVTEGEMKEAGMWGGEGDNEGLKNVLKAFTKLHAEFNVKFRAMWA